MTRRHSILIVDGYNVIHRVPRFRAALDRDLASARNALVGYCTDWRVNRRDFSDIYVVFDGSSDCREVADHRHGGVRVIYTNSGQSADERIISLVDELCDTCSCTVVSDDRFVIDNAKRLFAGCMSTETFHSTGRRGLSVKLQGDVDKTGLAPQERASITTSLMREWGLDSGEKEK